MSACLDRVIPNHREFSVYRADDGFLILYPDSAFWFKITAEQLPAFRLFDGKTTIRVLLDRAVHEIPTSLRRVSIKLLKDVGELFPANVREPSKPEAVSILYIMMTSVCNANCIYCFREACAKGTFFDKQHLRWVLSSFKHIATDRPTVIFTGGEPTLHPGLLEIAEFSKRNGYENTLQTNGQLIDSENAAAFAKVFDTVIVSIDSIDPRTGDWLRGKRGYTRRAMAALACLQDCPLELRISVTLTKLNSVAVQDIEDMFPKAKVRFTPMIGAGRAKLNSDISFAPDTFLHDLLSTGAYGAEAFGVDNIPRLGFQNTTCSAGTGILSLSPKGDVYPCQMLHHEKFKCGSTLQQPLDEIYAESNVLDRLRKLRVDSIVGCRDCDLRNICAGGCLANGFWKTDQFPVKDSFCEYNKQVYTRSLNKCFAELRVDDQGLVA